MGDSMENFPAEDECCICGAYIECRTSDDDLNGRVCKECHSHVKVANQVIIDDLRAGGILK